MKAVLVLLFLGYKDFLPFLCAQGLCGKVSNSEKCLGALGSQERPDVFVIWTRAGVIPRDTTSQAVSHKWVGRVGPFISLAPESESGAAGAPRLVVSIVLIISYVYQVRKKIRKL